MYLVSEVEEIQDADEVVDLARANLARADLERADQARVDLEREDLEREDLARREGADAHLDAMVTAEGGFFQRLSEDSTTTHPTDVLNTVTGRDIDSLVSNTQENASVEEICLQGPNELPQGDVVTNVLEINARDVVVHGL